MTNCVGYDKLLFHERYAARTRHNKAHNTSVKKKSKGKRLLEGDRRIRKYNIKIGLKNKLRT